MTVDLKPYFDAARTADDEVQRIMADMNAAFTEGTDEGKQRALDLRPALDAAKAKAQEANDLYISMRNASAQSGTAAREFVPVSNPDNLSGGNQPQREMARNSFLALSAAEQMKFVKDGGSVVDPE